MVCGVDVDFGLTPPLQRRAVVRFAAHKGTFLRSGLLDDRQDLGHRKLELLKSLRFCEDSWLGEWELQRPERLVELCTVSVSPTQPIDIRAHRLSAAA